MFFYTFVVNKDFQELIDCKIEGIQVIFIWAPIYKKIKIMLSSSQDRLLHTPINLFYVFLYNLSQTYHNSKIS